MNELGNTPADKNYKPSGISRAEDAALKAYPVKLVDRIINGAECGEVDGNIINRLRYQQGYEQAEKDAALVPKDIEEIIHIYHIVKMTINEDDDEFYQDILDEYYRRKALEEQE